jgi:hypothetical protein
MRFIRRYKHYSRNTTGEVDVALTRSRTRAGTIVWRYVAQWPTAAGRSGRATFSVSKYGKAEARRLAVEARRGGVAAFMGSKGR